MPADSKLLSIVIRTMPGRGALLQRALNSVWKQTYRPIEVLVVEDGGRTNADLIGEMTSTVDMKIRYLPREKIGRCEAGNVGLAQAKGEFLCFLDDDDEFLPNHASDLMSAMDINSYYKAAYAASFISYSDIVSLSPLVIVEHRRELFGRWNFDLKALWKFNMFPIQAVIFRRSLYEEFGGLCGDLDAYEDWDLWLRYASDTDFLYVDTVTSRFRLPSSAKEREKRAETHTVYLTKLRQRQAEMLKWSYGNRRTRIMRASAMS